MVRLYRDQFGSDSDLALLYVWEFYDVEAHSG